MADAAVDDKPAPGASAATADPPQLSKSARKKLLKQQRLEQRKAERRSAEKERRRCDLERRRREWDEKLAGADDEERAKMVEGRRQTRRERMGARAAEREEKTARLRRATEVGQRVVVDLEFAELMSKNEIHSLVHQLMFCYAANGKCAAPAHLMFTGCKGEIQSHLQRLPGYDRWIMDRENRPYIEAFEDQKENLVYLTADSDTELENLDLNKIYIIGGLVDRNRWKGITLNKAQEQGIHTARLPISTYLKLSSSQVYLSFLALSPPPLVEALPYIYIWRPRVTGPLAHVPSLLSNMPQVLTVNQVFEIVLRFMETKDWKDAFFKVIPQRKRTENGAEFGEGSAEHEVDSVTEDLADAKELGDMTGEEEEKDDIGKIEAKKTMPGEEEEDENEDEERRAKKIRLEQDENGN